MRYEASYPIWKVISFYMVLLNATHVSTMDFDTVLEIYDTVLEIYVKQIILPRCIVLPTYSLIRLLSRSYSLKYGLFKNT